jgi:hypothetical protein
MPFNTHTHALKRDIFLLFGRIQLLAWHNAHTTDCNSTTFSTRCVAACFLYNRHISLPPQIIFTE